MTRPSEPPLTVFATNPNADLYGASRMFLESVQGMRARGWRVVVSTAERDGPLLDAMRDVGCEERVVPNPVLRKTYLTPRGLVRLVALTLRAIPAGIGTLREVRPDVLYVNTITQPLWMLLARCLRIPVVCHVHEGEATAPRAVRLALSFPLVLAQRLVVNSRFSMSVVTGVLPRLAPRFVVVANGVAGPPGVEPPRPELDGSIRLLYVGRLSERKGIGDAIDAARLLGNREVEAQLDVVGAIYPGNEAFEAALRQTVRDYGLEERVCFRGFDPDIWPWLAGADVLLVPSRTDEPFGNTAVEGILAARPVIATGSGGLGEATEGFEAALTVPPSSPADLAAAVERIAGEWTAFRERALRDAGTAAARHAPARYQAALAEALLAVLPGASPAPATRGERRGP